MKKLFTAVSLLVFLVFACSSCILDPKPTTRKDDGNNDEVWPDLKDKDDVFEYLVLVHKRMDTNRYDKLLDENYLQVFSNADFTEGKTPEYWERPEELASARNMFTGHAVPKYGAVTNITLTLVPEGLWIAVPKTEPPFEGETWYQRTAEYQIVVSTNESWTLQGLDIKALFTVRFTEAGGDSIWRLVQMNDDIEN